MSPYGSDTRPSDLPHVTFYATGDNERYWVSPSLPRCPGVAGTRWLDDGVVGRGSSGEGLCEFRFNPAGDSDLKPATVPI